LRPHLSMGLPFQRGAVWPKATRRKILTFA
jgi:hypothetical protein